MNIDKHRRPVSDISNSESSSGIRILLADSHPVVRIGVANLLQVEKDLLVAGESGDGDEVIHLTLTLQPTILLLDFKMQKTPWTEILQVLQEKASPVRIILLAETISRQEMADAFHRDVHGSLLKRDLPSYLTMAVRAVAAGHLWVHNKRARSLQEALHLLPADVPVKENGPHGLTPRELEIVRCVVELRSNRDIANQFALSEETVKRHLSNIFEKTGVTTRLELALFAVKNKLVIAQ